MREGWTGPPAATPSSFGRSDLGLSVILADGAQIRFLPPYSPDFNPIEQAFAKLKAFLRTARPRSFDQVCDLIATAIGLFTPSECANYVRHSGYRLATSL